MTETTIWMSITSADLLEMYNKAVEIEQNAKVGDSVIVKIWNCPTLSDHKTYIKVVVDQERASKKGLMK